MTTVSIQPKAGTLPAISPDFFWTERIRKADLVALSELREKHGFKKVPANLLTLENGNAKLAKGDGLYTVGLSLQPASVSGWNNCPSSTKECRKFCLATCGRNIFSNAFRARQYRTELLYTMPSAFLRILASELNRIVKRKGPISLRLNVLSDLPFHRGIFNAVINEAIGPDSRRYEYTKVKDYLFDSSNVHFTYSARSEKLDPLDGDFIRSVLDHGNSVAVVTHRAPGTTLNGYPTIDGDENDRRYLDPKGCYVFLKPKGKLANSSSPFIYEMGN